MQQLGSGRTGRRRAAELDWQRACPRAGDGSQGFTYAQTLTVVQMARCVVRSFPYYPDIPAIVLWLAPGDKNSGPGPGLH